MNETLRTTKAKLWPRISGQGQRSEFRLRVLVLEVFIRVLQRQIDQVLQLLGDFISGMFEALGALVPLSIAAVMLSFGEAGASKLSDDGVD